jgi:hypothetical protein
VTGARLILFFAKVTKPGVLSVNLNTSAFQETFTTATIPFPSVGSVGGTDVAVTAANNKGYLVIPGLELVVQDWLNNPSTEFGINLSGDATLNVLLTAKEGSVGASAVLEIDVNPTGGSIVAGTISSSNEANLNSLRVTNSIELNGDVDAGGAVGGASLSSAGTLTVGGQTTFNAAVTIKNNKNLTIQGTGGIDVGGNVTANLFASSSMATDNLTAHVNANIQGTSTFGGKATFNGQSVFLGDMTLGSGKELGGGGSIDLGGTIQTTGDVRFGSSLAVGSGSFASRGQLDVRGKSGSIPSQPAGTVLSFIVLNSPFIGSSSNFDLSSGSGIFCDSDIIGGSINALSDERIKDIQGRSDSGADLAKVLQIEVTDYFYKDRFYRGNRPQKKLIAQQVEKIFPQAVSQHTDVVPDIYQAADSTDGWVSLATDLCVGDRVRLIGTKQKEDGVYEVTEVSESGFRTAFQPEGAKVFVYGREVKDFRTVDYEAVAMLNVSATQEIAKKLAAKDAEVNDLRAANAVLAAKVAALEARATARVDHDAELAARLARLEASLSERPAQVTTAALELK